jgi:hypothetical protein
MDVTISGVIVQALPIQSGVSQRGTQWSRASYLIEHESGQYPKRMVFDVSGNKIQELNLQVGEQVTLHLNISCREYPENSNKFFNSIEAWKADRMGYQQPMQSQYQQPQGGYAPQQQYQQPMQQPMQQHQYQQPMQQPVQQPMQPQAPQNPFPPQVNGQGQPMQQPQGQQQLPFPPAQ